MCSLKNINPFGPAVWPAIIANIQIQNYIARLIEMTMNEKHALKKLFFNQKRIAQEDLMFYR